MGSRIFWLTCKLHKNSAHTRLTCLVHKPSLISPTFSKLSYATSKSNSSRSPHYSIHSLSTPTNPASAPVYLIMIPALSINPLLHPTLTLFTSVLLTNNNYFYSNTSTKLYFNPSLAPQGRKIV